MNRKWRLGTWFGIDVYIHWTFFLLLGWALLFEGGLVSVVFISAIFACVVAHEYGHVLMARRFGIGTRDITLYPIGGVAALRAMPKRPREEMAVALAGPAVNIIIALILGGFLWLSGLATDNYTSLGGFLTAITVTNVILALFNLLPAFPMDGGRVLRAWLARNRDYLDATRLAAKVGRAFAAGFVVIGLFKGMPMLILLAAFVYLAAGAEYRQAQIERQRRMGFGGAFFQFPFDQGTPHTTPPPPPHNNDDDVIDVEVVPMGKR